MHGEIAISEPEPVFSTELRKHVHEVPALAGSTPTGVCVAEFGEGVHQRVDVGRDMQSQVLKIVTGVDQETELVGIQQPAQSQRQLGAADAAREGQVLGRGHVSETGLR